MASELRLVVPMTPPSNNTYKTYRIVTPRGGKPFVHWYLTDTAKAWFGMLAMVAAGRQIRGSKYELQLVVFMPNARSIDLDNCFKVVGDGLQHAGVIDNDKHITDLHGHMRIDRINPRTVIVVKTDQESLL